MISNPRLVLKSLRYSKKARINSDDVLADALDKAYSFLKLKTAGHSDLDAEIQVYVL